MNKHQPLEKEEQMIYEAFAEINVDTTSLKNKMKKSSYEKARRPMKLSFAMMAMVALLVVSGTVYAATGGLAELIERFNPSFGEYAVAPAQPIYVVDQDIRFEVYGAKAFDNTILVYFSLQDISGENRLDEYALPWIYGTEGEESTPFGASWQLLNFDSFSNTLYYEAILTVHSPSPLTSEVAIKINNIYSAEFSEEVTSGNPFLLIQGDWLAIVPIDEMDNRILVLEDITKENINISRLVISPLGVYIEGVSVIRSHERDQERRENPCTAINIELACGDYVKFMGGGGSPGHSMFMSAYSPIDIGEVVAIIVYGTRIPIP